MTKRKPTPAVPATQTIQLIWAGLRRLSGNVGGGLFYHPTDFDNIPDDLSECVTRVFGYSTVKNLGNPGTVFTFDAPPQKPDRSFSIYHKTARISGRYNKPVVVEWQALHDAVRRRRAITTYERAEKATSQLDKHVAALRLAYRVLDNKRDQSAFLAELVFRICNE